MNYDRHLPTYEVSSTDLECLFVSQVGADRNASARRERIGTTLVERLPETMRALYDLLTSRNESNAPWMDARNALAEHGLRMHGLNRSVDFNEHVLPVLGGVLQTVAADKSLENREALRLMARATATTVAESQTFADGNHRIAQALRHYISHGPSDFNVNHILNARKSFRPTVGIEKLILQQNTARLVGTAALASYELPRDIYVEPELVDDISRLEAAIGQKVDETMHEIADEYGVEYSPIFESSAIYRLSGATGMPDERLSPHPANVLSSRTYAAGAFRAFAGTELPELPLNGLTATALVQTDLQLHIMRQMSLLKGVMAGGFVKIEEDPTGAYHTTRLPWNYKELAQRED